MKPVTDNPPLIRPLRATDYGIPLAPANTTLVGKTVRWHWKTPRFDLPVREGSGVVLDVQFTTDIRTANGTSSHWKLLVETATGLAEIYAEWVVEVKS